MDPTDEELSPLINIQEPPNNDKYGTIFFAATF